MDYGGMSVCHIMDTYNYTVRILSKDTYLITLLFRLYHLILFVIRSI